ncbi:MAG: LamG domain-containing protein, partial [FCB group bacterium]|nr:LamG domain-containing protein [FCB group bacterium]
DTAAGSIAPGRWSHVAVSCDGVAARTLIDGAVVSEAAVSGLRAAVDPLRLGDGFQGALAAARLWSIARPEEELAADQGRLLAGTETGLAADWPLDEASGTEVLNRVSGGPAGTLVGGIHAVLPATPFPGQQALDLDGSGARIEVPHAPEIHFARTDESFTVELWVRPGAGDAESVLLEKWSGIGSYPYALRYRPAGGEIVFARSTGAASSTAELTVSTAGIDDGEFHHLAAVKDGSILRLYVDGALASEMVDPITSTIRGESALHVGSRGGTGHFFSGAITELRLWRRARTAAEIDAGRWQRLSGGEVDLAGYWPLDAVA